MKVQEATEGIAQFMGRDFGEMPEIIGATYQAFLDIMWKARPETPLPVRMRMAEDNMKKKDAFYYQKSHTILLPEESSTRTLVHELTHAYTRNHWPEAFNHNIPLHELMLKRSVEKIVTGKLLTEGLAQYVEYGFDQKEALGVVVAHDILFEKRENSLVLGSEAIRELSGLLHFDCQEQDPFTSRIYSVGHLVVASLLRGENEKYEIFGKAVKNLPRSIDAMTSIIEQNIVRDCLREYMNT